METLEIQSRPDASLLAEAFPSALRRDSLAAGESVLRELDKEQRSERLSLRLGEEHVLIPARLRFALPPNPDFPLSGEAGLMALCLRTRSNDGFERQAAARHVLADVRPWSAPFIVILIGEWVVEILEEVKAAMSPPLLEALAPFIAANPDYWRLTKQRVASYWNAYYRQSGSRSTYVGFSLLREIDAFCRSQPGVPRLGEGGGRR